MLTSYSSISKFCFQHLRPGLSLVLGKGGGSPRAHTWLSLLSDRQPGKGPSLWSRPVLPAPDSTPFFFWPPPHSTPETVLPAVHLLFLSPLLPDKCPGRCHCPTSQSCGERTDPEHLQGWLPARATAGGMAPPVRLKQSKREDSGVSWEGAPLRESGRPEPEPARVRSEWGWHAAALPRGSEHTLQPTRAPHSWGSRALQQSWLLAAPRRGGGNQPGRDQASAEGTVVTE